MWSNGGRTSECRTVFSSSLGSTNESPGTVVINYYSLHCVKRLVLQCINLCILGRYTQCIAYNVCITNMPMPCMNMPMPCMDMKGYWCAFQQLYPLLVLAL